MNSRFGLEINSAIKGGVAKVVSIKRKGIYSKALKRSPRQGTRTVKSAGEDR